MKRMLGYADESGETGVKKNENDYFVFCIVLMKDQNQAQKIEEKIAKFRQANNLPSDHEFHYATDSKKTRAAFINFIKGLNFEFISVSIKKDGFRNTASFATMSNLVLRLFEEKQINVGVLMDSNPRLCRELRVRRKEYATDSYFRERKSHASDLIQLTDYVVALRTRFLKYRYKKSVAESYNLIIDKMVGSIEV